MCAYFSCILDIFRTAGTVKKPTEIFFSNYSIWVTAHQIWDFKYKPHSFCVIVNISKNFDVMLILV